MLIVMIKSSDDMYLYEVNDQHFILDPYSQMFWFIKDTDDDNLLLTIDQLKKYNFFKKKGKFVIEKKEIKEDIKHIVINPSFECNLDCWYCYSRDYHYKNIEEMSLNKIQRIILFFSRYKQEINSTRPLAISMFFTSEITLSFSLFREVGKFIEQLNKEYSFDFYLFPASTNLMSISDEFVEYVNNYGYINVSLDLENKEQVATVLKNLSRFDSTVVKHCIIPLNSRMNNLFSIYSFFMKSFDYVSMRPVRVTPHSKIPWTEKSISEFKTELVKLIEKLLLLNEEDLLDFMYKLGSSDYLARFIDRIISRKRYNSRCLAGRNEIAISPVMSFYPCSGLIGYEKYKVGSISEGLIHKSFFESRKSNDIINSECRKCPICFYCGGVCLDWFEKQNQISGMQTNSVECEINLHYFKLCSYLIYNISKNYSRILDLIARKKEIDNRLSYPLDFSDFSLFFQSCSS